MHTFFETGKIEIKIRFGTVILPERTGNSMDMLHILTKKRYGETLQKEEIDFFVEKVTKKEIPDYQVSAFLMAVTLNGMTDEEMTALTLAMAYSGDICDLSGIPGRIVDKHSTGGVGDKCTPVLLSVLAACGVPVAKLSGRGLGFTGGTIDKLESMKGFRTSIPVSSFAEQVRRYGMVLSGQTPELAPADKILYELRDVTATVESIPLIAASIMSKKIAGGAEAIVLDITYGSGAFMKTIERARTLSAAMLRIGNIAKKKVICVLTPMEEPLGTAIGNVLEIEEVWALLHGKGEKDVLEICLSLASCMIFLSDQGEGRSLEFCRNLSKEAISSGKAADSFSRFVCAQGGEINEKGKPVFLCEPQRIGSFTAERNGYISRMDALLLGEASMLLGAGRRKKGDTIDPGAGLVLCKKVGDKVEKGDALLYMYSGAPEMLSRERIMEANGKMKEAILYENKMMEKKDIEPEILFS